MPMGLQQRGELIVMYIKNQTLGVVFRVVFLIACGAGLVIKLIYSGFSLPVIFGDFALISNFFALVYFAYLIIARPNYERGVLRGAVTIYVIITFIVYYFINFGASSNPAENLNLAGYLLYFISPVMVVLDYLLFCRKGSFTAYSPVIWAVIPVMFNIAVFLLNKFITGIEMIPYFNLLGMDMTITMLVFLGISYLLFVADNIFAVRHR